MSDATNNQPRLPTLTLPPGYVPVAIPPPEEGQAAQGAPGAVVAPPPPAPREPLPFGYRLTTTDAVVRSDGLHIENWPSPEREEFAFWLSRGGEPEPAEPAAPVVPATITARQAEQALILAGLFDQVGPAIAAIPDAQQRALIEAEWRRSQVFERHRPTLIALAKGALGMTDEQLDQLFITGATL